MILGQVFDRFAKQAPVSVMMRAALENVLSPERLDAIFEEYSREQYSGDLLFSTVVEIMGEAVCRVHPSVNAAFRGRAKTIGVTIKSGYDKLKGIEPRVSRAGARDGRASPSHIAKGPSAREIVGARLSREDPRR